MISRKAVPFLVLSAVAACGGAAGDVSKAFNETEGTAEQIFSSEVKGAVRVAFFPKTIASEVVSDGVHGYAVIIDSDRASIVRVGDDAQLTLAELPRPPRESYWQRLLIGIQGAYLFYTLPGEHDYAGVYRVRTDGSESALPVVAGGKVPMSNTRTSVALSGDHLFVEDGASLYRTSVLGGELVPWASAPASVREFEGEGSAAEISGIVADDSALFAVARTPSDYAHGSHLERYDIATMTTTTLARELGLDWRVVQDADHVYVLSQNLGASAAPYPLYAVDKRSGAVDTVVFDLWPTSLTVDRGLIYAVTRDPSTPDASKLSVLDRSGAQRVIASSDIAEVPLDSVAVDASYVWIAAGHGVYRLPTP
jgi:hypothetical protein